MSHSASEEIEAFHAAKDDGEREYWTRRIIIRRIRAHGERNQELLRSAHVKAAITLGYMLTSASAGLLMYAWLNS